MIDTKALRKKILELAFSGKLIPDSIHRDSSIELMNSIINEKKRLVNEKRIGKIKALAPIKEDEKVFPIPTTWIYSKLGDLTTPLSDGVHYAPEYQQDGYKCFSAKDIYDNQINDSDCTYITSEEYLGMKDKINVHEGSILITKSGSIGRSAIVKEYYEFGLVESIGVINLIIINPEYIKYVLDYGFVYSSYYLEKYTRGVGLKHLTLTLLENIPIPLAPLAEQEYIVNMLNKVFKLMDKIDILQQQYSSDLAILKGKIFDAGIRGKLTEQLPEDGDAENLYSQIQKEKIEILKIRGGRQDKSIKTEDEEKPFEIPSNWKWIRFGEVGLFKKGPFGSALTKSMFVPKTDDTVKIYEQQHAIKKDANLGNYYISREYFESNMTGFEVKSGDIIVSCAGTIGETYIMPPQLEQGIINQALMRVTLVPSILNEFFLYYFDSNLKTDARNESNGMAIKNIPPFDVMKNWYFPLPPLAEQKRITKKIDELLQIIG